MKVRFDIEIRNSDKICGGYLMTTPPMTTKQVVKFAEKMGRELMNNDKSLDTVSYSCWEADNEDIENAACVGVIVYRFGRKIMITTY